MARKPWTVCTTVNGVCMNGLSVVEATWRRTGITGIIKHAMAASYEEISCKTKPPALAMHG